MERGQQPPGVIPGAAGFNVGPSMQAFLQGQAGQIQGVPAHAILAQRLAAVPPGSRGGGGGGAQAYRAAAQQVPMGVMIKPPNRKNNASVKGRKSCNCKNSKCLKLYCECFASGRYCDNCNCLSCFNNKESEAVRQAAVETILERNPNAFRPKIQTAEGDTHPQSIRNAPDGSVRHTKGCNCKKSSCLKKYCECFQGSISCTEICKCVDCKNFDGSEARAQVISHGDPYSMHAAAVAAQQQALKRPRMQLQQQLQQQPFMQQQGLANMLQQQPQALQQLAAAVSMGPSAAAAAGLQPLQYQALAAGLALPNSGMLPAVSAALPAAAAAAAPGAGAAGLTATESNAAAALPQLPSRPPVLDALHDLVKPNVVDDLCTLLLVVAQEQADKFAQQQQQDGQPDAGGGGITVKVEAAAADGVDTGDAADGSSRCNGLKRRRDESGNAPGGAGDHAEEEDQGEHGAAAAKRAAAGDEEAQRQQNGVAAPAAGEGAGEEGAGLTDLYVRQEGMVLHEFNSLMQRILSQADRKVAAEAEAAAASAAEAAAAAADASAAAAAADQAAVDQAAAAAAAAAAMYDGLGDMSDPQQQQLLLQQMAEQLQQHQQEQLQQQHDMKGLGSSRGQLLPHQQQQQQALAAQQALLMQAAAANQNLALLQASRGMYMQGAAQQQQQQLMSPLMMQAAGGVGNINALQRPNAALQMVQVMAPDGTLHQVPAHAFLSMQMAAAAGGQQQQLESQQAAAGGGGAAAAAGGVGDAGGGQPISLLSLLNGTGTTSGNSS